MKVAVIDDEKEARDILDEYLKRFSLEKNCSMEVKNFDSGIAFLDEYRSDYDILFFDVEMPGLNGLDTARKIRAVDKNCVILFITNIAQYAIQGYEVDAIDYVLKPITYPDFAMKMKKAMNHLALKSEKYISIEAMDGLHRVKVSEIEYVEVLAHVIIYHVNGNEWKVKGNMKDIEKQFLPYHFARVYKSYLVNLACVKTVRTNDIVVGKTVLPIGRVYKKEFMQKFMEFMQG